MRFLEPQKKSLDRSEAMAIDLISELRASALPGTHVGECMIRAADEIEELRRRLGGGCEVRGGGDHLVITEGRYKFCGDCGESLTGVRYCHAPRQSS